MRARAMLVLVFAGCAAFPSMSHAAADYGRWRVTVSGHLTENWQSGATTPCAITGSGGVDLGFKTSSPITVHIRRRAGFWTIRTPAVLRLDVAGTVSGDAVQQPPSSPDDTCQWPAPDTWACGPLAYSAREEMLAGS